MRRPAAGQAVAVQREPENAFDPNAVAVRTLAEQSLGYVPKDLTARFPQQLCFGRVYSVGQSEGGAWGFKVRPGLPAL